MRLVGAVLEREADGKTEVVSTGAGAAALGDPSAAVAWAANTLGPLGVTMEAGQIVMTGPCTRRSRCAPETSFTARFDRLGSVTVRFS